MFEKKSEIKAIKSECKHFCVFLQIGQYIRIAEKERNDQKKKKIKKIKKKSVFATSYNHEMSRETMFY